MPTIAETYRRTKKSPDLAWNEYVCRPIAAVLVAALAGSRVTPNQVTLAALGVAVLSAALLVAWPGWVGLVVAVVVFELSYILDCADGMLARLRGTASATGHLFDFLMDELKAFLVLAAASVRLFREHDDERYLVAGLGGLVALASGIALTTFVRRPEVAGQGAGTVPAVRGGLVGLVERGAKLVIHYPSYIWIAALTGHLEVYLFPYVLVNALYATRMLLSVALRFGRT